MYLSTYVIDFDTSTLWEILLHICAIAIIPSLLIGLIVILILRIKLLINKNKLLKIKMNKINTDKNEHS